MGALGHAWLPRADCGTGCLSLPEASAPLWVGMRCTRRVTLLVLVLLVLIPVLPLLVLPLPGRRRSLGLGCRLLLLCLGIRISLSGNPIRNLRGVLVVSDHTSWLDVLALSAVIPAAFVARADMFTGGIVGLLARLLGVIPIDRASLRTLPAVVEQVARRLRGGQTVVVFPEGTTWCGRPGPGHSGVFYPALFQAAIDAARPVQPVALGYRNADGSLSTAPAYIGTETLLRTLWRVLSVRRTVACVRVESLRLPGGDRRALARHCQSAIRPVVRAVPLPTEHDHALAV